MRRLAVLALLVAACGTSRSSPTATPGEFVSRDMMGDDWPLTVDSGWLRCEPWQRVIINVDGVDYGINGMATTQYPFVRPIWAWLSKEDELRRDGWGLRRNIGPLMDRGFALCTR